MEKTTEERKQSEERESRMDFGWAPFYEELAARLGPRFRKEPGPVLYESFRAIFKAAGLAFPDSARLPPDSFDFIDALALLNQRLSDEKRASLLEAVKASPLGEGMVSPVPKSFPGLIAMPLGLTLLRPKREAASAASEGRKAAAEFFLEALDFARITDEAEREEAADDFAWSYDEVLDGADVPWNLTIALYWIAPRFYVPFDRWTIRAVVGRGWWWDETPLEGHGSLEDFTFRLPDGGFYLERRGKIGKRVAEEAGAGVAAFGIPGLVAAARTEWEARPCDPAAPRYWLFTPATSIHWEDEEWESFFEAGEIGVFDGIRLGDIGRCGSRKEIFREIEGAARGAKAPARLASDLWALRSMKPGDIVYARGWVQNTVMSRGVVESGYAYEKASPQGEGRYCVRIRWGALSGFECGELPRWKKGIHEITPEAGAVRELEENLIVRPYGEADFCSDPLISAGRLAECRAVIESGKPIAITGAYEHVPLFHFVRSLASLANGVWDMSRTLVCHPEPGWSGPVLLASPYHRWGFPPAEEGAQAERFENFCRRAAKSQLEGRPETFFFLMDGSDFAVLERANQYMQDAVAAEYRRLVKNPSASLPSPEKARLIALVDPEVCSPIFDGDPALRVPPESLKEKFAFFEMRSDFHLPCVQQWQAALDAKGMGKPFRDFIACFEALNAEIAAEPGLGLTCTSGPMFLEKMVASKDEEWLKESLCDYVIGLTGWLCDRFDGTGTKRTSGRGGNRAFLWQGRLDVAVRGMAPGGDAGDDDESDADE